MATISLLLTLPLLVLANYDYLLFVTEWPPTDYLMSSCARGYEYEGFNIHGLWPTNIDGTRPQYCSTTQFSVPASSEADMNEHWRSYSGNYVTFWTHEWERHGTCVADGETPDEFFPKVLELRAQYDPLTQLASKGIAPSSTT